MANKKNKLGYISPTLLQYVDADYLEKLSPEEFEWYSKFIQEYYQHNFSDEPINEDPKAYKEATQRENCSRRDIMNRMNRTEFDEERIDRDEILTTPTKEDKDNESY